MTDKEKLAEAERIRQENLKRISSSEYRRQERRVARVERAIRREVR